jgi:hypothetical protein
LGFVPPDFELGRLGDDFQSYLNQLNSDNEKHISFVFLAKFLSVPILEPKAVGAGSYASSFVSIARQCFETGVLAFDVAALDALAAHFEPDLFDDFHSTLIFAIDPFVQKVMETMERLRTHEIFQSCTRFFQGAISIAGLSALLSALLDSDCHRFMDMLFNLTLFTLFVLSRDAIASSIPSLNYSLQRQINLWSIASVSNIARFFSGSLVLSPPNSGTLNTAYHNLKRLTASIPPTERASPTVLEQCKPQYAQIRVACDGIDCRDAVERIEHRIRDLPDDGPGSFFLGSLKRALESLEFSRADIAQFVKSFSAAGIEPSVDVLHSLNIFTCEGDANKRRINGIFG